jgi:transposase
MKPYSYDLRIRIFNYSLTHSIRETARIFQVSPNTVYLLTQLFNETGSLNPRDNLHERPYLITPEGEQYLCLLLSKEVDLTLEELCNRYEQAYGIRVGIGTMYNTLERLNITRKKKTFHDPKKNSDAAKVEKESYDAQLELIEPDKRLYLDETGSCLNMTPLYGRSQQGERVYDEKPVSPGTSVSTVAILSEDGIKAQYTYTESLTAKLFILYLETSVLPIFESGQTLIMDRHPVHRAKIVQNYLKQNNVKFLYLPAYSPELNPIEEAFSKIKQYIKKQKARTIDKLLIVLKKAFEIITVNDVKGYFNHAAESLM